MTDPDETTYGGYLQLPTLLAAQMPKSDQHDEMLFVIIHQTKELWFRQIILELRQAMALIAAGRLTEVHKILSRVSRIQAVLTLSWDVLQTMTPVDYLKFRHVLGTSSGFQSAQFREIEFLLGLKDEAHLASHPADGPDRATLEAALDAPSLWDLASQAMAGLTGIGPLPPASRRPYQPSTVVEDGWIAVYREPERLWPLYQLAEKLVDLDESTAVWRHKHVVTVERVIGFKRGTGGTAGATYLQSTLLRRAFPELWSLRTRL